MKKVKLVNIVNINGVFDSVILSGAPIEDVRAIMRFRREAKPIVDSWNSTIRDAIIKLKSDNISQEQFNKNLNDALYEEAIREVEVTPFVITPDGEDIILAQSKITCKDLENINEILRPE